jgi:hypothetical protein
VYELPQELADAVAEKQKSDDAQTAQLVARGVPVVPVKTGNDGGMHTAFLSKYKPTLVQGNDGEVRTYVERLPGTTPETRPTRAKSLRLRSRPTPGFSQSARLADGARSSWS